MLTFVPSGMPTASLNAATYVRYTRVEMIQAWQRGEDFANRNVASSSSGVVGSTGTNTPMQPMMQAVQAPASMR